MSDQYWNDTYELGYRLYKKKEDTGGLGQRSELDALDKSLADQNANLFHFDPYKGTYELKNMHVTQERPIPPHVREIAECDLEEIKLQQTFSSNDYPKVINIKIAHVLAPNGLLVFNCDHEKTPQLASLTSDVSQPIKPAHMNDIIPGAILLFKDKKLYRVMILGQKREKYDVLLIDYGSTETVRLSKLYLMTKELETSRIPCGLLLTRIIGVAGFPKKEFGDFKAEIEKGRMDSENKKPAKLKAIILKDEKGDMIVDFQSLNRQKLTFAEALKCTSWGKPATEDPPLISYEKFISMPFSNKEDVQMKTKSQENEKDSALDTSLRAPSQASTIIKKRIPLPPKVIDKHNNNVSTLEAPRRSSIFGIQNAIKTELNSTISGFSNEVTLKPRKLDRTSNEANSAFGIQKTSSSLNSSSNSLSRRLTAPVNKNRGPKVEKDLSIFNKTETDESQHLSDGTLFDDHEISSSDHDFTPSSGKLSAALSDCPNGLAKIDQFLQFGSNQIVENNFEDNEEDKSNSTFVDPGLGEEDPKTEETIQEHNASKESLHGKADISNAASDGTNGMVFNEPDTNQVNMANVSADVFSLSEENSVHGSLNSDQKNEEPLNVNDHETVETNFEEASDIYSIIKAKIDKSINDGNYKAYYIDIVTIINMHETVQSSEEKQRYENLRIYAQEKFYEYLHQA